MKQQQEDNLLAKWADGKASPEEIQILSAKYDLDELSVVLSANSMLEVDTLSSTIVHKELQRKIKSGKVRKQTFRRALILLSVVVIGVLIYSLSSIFESATILRTDPGQRDTVLFADNTQVILGPSSSLEYNESTFIENRAFDLRGQAYFKVPTKGPLTVTGAFGTVSVLGTEFDVYGLPNGGHKISCYEGKVRVANTGTSTYKDLSERESITINSGKFENKTVLISSTPGWVRNKVSYNNVPIDEVLVDLSRYFGISFKKHDNMQASVFNGVVPIASLEECLEYFVTVTGWKYDQTPDSISFFR